MGEMRKGLKQIEGDRLRFSGIFERFGTKPRYKPSYVDGGWVDFDRTVLLIQIKDDNGKVVCDHLWMNYTKGFEKLGELEQGDLVFFNARVTEYTKGYVNHREYIDETEVDYRLSNPTKIEIQVK